MRMRFFIPLGVFWLGAIGTGLGFLAEYATRPGAVGDVPGSWPSDAGLALASDRHTLVLAVHPRCPCTRSSINELERSLSDAEHLPTIYALVFEPVDEMSDTSSDSFAHTNITRRLLELPGVNLVHDSGSLIAQRFGALTSGHAVVYERGGTLVYSGGLTPTRAHEGPNTGSSTLVSLFNGGDALARSAPVFGCPLCSSLDTPEMETCNPISTYSKESQ